MSDLQLHDPVALRQADPDHKLVEGQIGCIREIFSPDEFEVKFYGGVEDAIAVLRLNLQQVRLLRHEVTLTEQEFWKLIETAKADSNGKGERQIEILVDHFAQRSIADIYELDRIFHKFHNMADRSTLMAAYFIINAGCGHDGFMKFRGWLIAQGKKVFHDALRDPESLVDTEFDPVLTAMEFLAWRAYEKKTGQYNPHFCSVHTTPEGAWDEEWGDDDAVYKRYPKLSAKFYHK